MLRIYKTVVELVRLLASVFVKTAQHDADLARQARRAAASIALNVGEAAGVRGGNRRQRLLTALGSAREVEAACDVAEALGYATLDADTRAKLNHVIGALVLLTRCHRDASRLAPRRRHGRARSAIRMTGARMSRDHPRRTTGE